MTESTQWKREYSQLREFIAANSEIILTESEISIPQLLRDEFYQKFDEVRKAVVEDHLDALPVNARTLSENYIRMEAEVSQLLGVEKIGMPVDLLAFLHDPKEGLIRAIYGRLFDLLQGKISDEEFESLAIHDLGASAEELFRLGYERWAGLVLIKLLDPDQAYFVDLDEDFKPFLRELKEISFGRQAHHPTIRIPEFVVHSRKFNSLVAIKMPLARELEGYVVAFKPAVRPKKRTGDTSFALDSRAVLLTFMRDAKDIPVYADIYECTRTSPDWMIEYISGSELNNPSALLPVKQHLNELSPKHGVSLVVVGDAPEPEPGTIPENIRTVSAGFDQSRFQAMLNGIPVS